jgi:hypothetical protein
MFYYPLTGVGGLREAAQARAACDAAISSKRLDPDQ